MKRLLILAGLVLALAFPGYATGSAKSTTKNSSKPAGKTVHVKGYFRKDGTYVAPYDRSAPGSGASTGSKASGASSAAAPRSTGAATSNGSSPAAPGSTGCKTCPRDASGRIKRSEAAHTAFMRQTGYPQGRPGYVVDHIIPLECGGADDPSNMQWQTVEAAKAKDKTEARCRQ